MKNKLFIVFIKAGITIVMALFLNSCYYHKEEIYPSNSSCTDSITITYTGQMKSFFDNNCTGCHHSGGQSPYFDNFTDAHNYAITPSNKLNSYLLNNHQGISTSDCQKAQMSKWISTGANN